MIIRAKNFEAWMKRNLSKGQLKDLASHGAEAGGPGLTYYKDTRQLYEQHNDDIV